MKNKFKILIMICLSAISMGAHAQVWSTETQYIPSSSNSALISDASRFGYHYGDWSTFYMRDNDSSFFCSVLNVAMWLTVPTATKISLPQDFIITDFTRFLHYQGYIGSFQGTGMFGRAFNYNLPSYNYLQCFKLPAVNCLTGVAAGRISGENIPSISQVFAIGEKYNSILSPQSYLLEFYAESATGQDPYRYAPLLYDSLAGEQEIADDVILMGKHVVYATRDTRRQHADVNLRIADTHNVLLNTDIDYRWQFYLPSNEKLASEIRLVALDTKELVMAYVVKNKVDDKNYLCVNKINLSDFFAHNNTIVTHEIPIEDPCL